MNLSTKLAEKLANALGYNDEQRAVLAYGLGAAIQMLELFIIALVFGLVFDCAYESIILFLGVGFLRRSCGGTHCTGSIVPSFRPRCKRFWEKKL